MEMDETGSGWKGRVRSHSAVSLYAGDFLLFLLQGLSILKLWALLSLCACVIYLFPTRCDWSEMEAAGAQCTCNCSCSCPIFCSCLKEHCFGEGKAGTAISYAVMSRACTMQPWNYHLHALLLSLWNFPNKCILLSLRFALYLLMIYYLKCFRVGLCL